MANPTEPTTKVNILDKDRGNTDIQLAAPLRWSNPAHAATTLANLGGGGGGGVRPEDHGAVGDGVTDDTVHVQAALNAIGSSASGGKLVLGKYYATTTPLRYGFRNRPLWICGEGQHTGIVSLADSGSIFIAIPHNSGATLTATGGYGGISVITVTNTSATLVTVSPPDGVMSLDVVYAAAHDAGYYTVDYPTDDGNPIFHLTPSTDGDPRTITVNFTGGDGPNPLTATEAADSTKTSEGIVGLHFSDLGIRSKPIRTAGSAIEVHWSENTVIERVMIGEPQPKDEGGADIGWQHFGGIKLVNQSNCHIEDTAVFFQMTGIYISGTLVYDGNHVPYAGDQGSLCGDCVIWGMGYANADASDVIGSIGVHIAGGNGGFSCWGNISVSGVMDGAAVTTDNGQPNREVFFNDLLADRCAGSGIRVDDGSYASLNIRGGWGAGDGGAGSNNGLKVGTSTGLTGAAGAISIFGGNYYSDTSSSIYIAADLNTVISITGVTADDLEIVSCARAAVTGGAIGSAILHGQNVTVKNVAGLPELSSHTAVAASYTATILDELISVTSTSSARTITLPAANAVGASPAAIKKITVKDESGAAGTHNITIARAGSDTIDGATSLVISTNYGKATVYSDGTHWFTL